MIQRFKWYEYDLNLAKLSERSVGKKEERQNQIRVPLIIYFEKTNDILNNRAVGLRPVFNFIGVSPVKLKTGRGPTTRFRSN